MMAATVSLQLIVSGKIGSYVEAYEAAQTPFSGGTRVIDDDQQSNIEAF